jgi:hypothetical protein
VIDPIEDICRRMHARLRSDANGVNRMIYGMDLEYAPVMQLHKNPHWVRWLCYARQ